MEFKPRMQVYTSVRHVVRDAVQPHRSTPVTALSKLPRRSSLLLLPATAQESVYLQSQPAASLTPATARASHPNATQWT